MPKQFRASLLNAIVAILALTITAAGLGIVVLLWLFLSERYENTLAVLLLYLGLLDGYLKLRTNSSAITLVRDGALYPVRTSIFQGFLAKPVAR